MKWQCVTTKTRARTASRMLSRKAAEADGKQRMGAFVAALDMEIGIRIMAKAEYVALGHNAEIRPR